MSSSDSQFLQSIEPKLEVRQAPCNRAVIIGQLARLANHFRAERPADAWQMLFEDYAEDLAGISEPHLREIILDHRAGKPWFPKISDLVERWNAMRFRENEELRRARVCLGSEAPKPWEAHK